MARAGQDRLPSQRTKSRGDHHSHWITPVGWAGRFRRPEPLRNPVRRRLEARDWRHSAIVPVAAHSRRFPRFTSRGSIPTAPTRAQRIGASAASELAVERALDWLTRHQDDDGRWDGGIARYEDGTPVKGDDDFTVHCPAGETCFGECAYWEADTALTGLALLTYLGAGYTHTDGRYAEAVGKGLDFLIEQQKPDGDLRGTQPGRRHVLPCDGHAGLVRGLCPDR